MESPVCNIFIEPCQYTPIYFVDPSITQAKSYVVTQNISSDQKPASDNLKKFYENSGNLENNIHSSENNIIAKNLKKPENNVLGNNLKLASFLQPKSEPSYSKQVVPQANNVILKPVYIANTPNIVSNTPKLDVNSKIVKLKEMPNMKRTISNKNFLPKMMPKDNTTTSKHTSVQLLKLGETYHSLNQLSEKQMELVNHALNIFKNPENAQPQPTYDPVTNTKYIYKVVSPKDLTVVGKKNLLLTKKKLEPKKVEKKIVKKEPPESETLSQIPVFLENAVTRSGRKVKISKNILQEEVPNKSKRKVTTVVSCQNCSSSFSSMYRLQRHYEIKPTHAPEKLHSNLFQCLSAIIKSNTNKSPTTVFIEQLEQFISKLRSCIPCLLKIDDNTNIQSNSISEEVARLLGIQPGNYNFNMDALHCTKDLNGHCQHKTKVEPKIEGPQLWFDQQDKGGALEEDIDCTNLPKNRPTIKMAEVRKLKSDHHLVAKKMKVNDISAEISNISTEDIVALLTNTGTIDNLSETNTMDKEVCNELIIENATIDEDREPKTCPKQFHSTHFDIRSSPIKSTSSTFSKFQINTENMPKYKVHVIQPLQQHNQLPVEDIDNNLNDLSAQKLFDTSVMECKVGSEQFDSTKSWSNEQTNDLMTNNNLINNELNKTMDSSLIHVNSNLQSTPIDIAKHSGILIHDHLLTNHEHLLSNHEHSMDTLNFLESLGNECIYPETEIRNNTVDFQLDLFSFNST